MSAQICMCKADQKQVHLMFFIHMHTEKETREGARERDNWQDLCMPPQAADDIWSTASASLI